MDLTQSLALDWRTWDDTESVVHEWLRSAGPADAFGNEPTSSEPVAIPVAKRLDMTSREVDASAGAYVAGDVTWLVPGVFLSRGAKPGDLLRVGDTEQWNVLDTTFVKEDGVWEIHARNPVIAYDLRDLVDIERPAISYDDSGAAIMLFPSGAPPNGGKVAYPKIACQVQSDDNEIAEERGIRGTQTKYKVFVSRQLVVTQYDRVVWGAHILDVLALRNSDRIDELPWLECVEKVVAG